jgi:hypothetical protein
LGARISSIKPGRSKRNRAASVWIEAVSLPIRSTSAESAPLVGARCTETVGQS